MWIVLGLVAWLVVGLAVALLVLPLLRRARRQQAVEVPQSPAGLPRVPAQTRRRILELSRR